ncbi:MAG: alpha/beta hydrolase-fold protein [Bryobacteraceae bacterium]
MTRPEWLFAPLFGLALAAAQTAPYSGPPIRYEYGSMDWVDPDRTTPEGAVYKTFRSPTIQADVSYLVYLPPDYEQRGDSRYPVLYELPASGGTPSRDMAEIVKRVDAGIRAHRLLPMIIIGVNGLRGNTMYCDSRDGLYPLETVIVKDLIPHVDATYRTVASREGRALNGFSMGGFGAAHLGFKFPDLFGVISIMAPPLLGPELKQPLPAKAWSRLFPTAMAGDLEYFRANDPFTLAEKNAAKLRDRTVIRIVAHWENEQWLWPQCEKLHQVLLRNMVPHEFYFLMNVKGHNRGQCLNTMGDGAFAFFSSSLLKPQTGAPALPRAAGAAPAPVVPRATTGPPGPAGWERLPDGSQGRETEFQGVGGVAIPAYLRKPAGPGPFPAIVMAHGGRYGKAATVGMGRSMQSPVVDFLKEGWAVYSIDYRPVERIGIEPVEFDDSVAAIQALRKLPFIDPKRIGWWGASHGAQVGSRVVSRVDLAGAVLCAPAALDLIEVKKGFGRGEKLAAVLKKMVADMEKERGASAEEIEKNPARYGYTSALTEVAQVRAPILVINGRDDDNSPPSIIEVYVRKLRAAGKQVETYQPDHGPHGFYTGRPDIPEWKESARRTVAFFRARFSP